MKVYQMSQEQVDNFSNDLIDVLNQTQEVSQELKSFNLENKDLIENLKLDNDMIKNIDFLLDKMDSIKSEMKIDFRNLETLSSKIDKKNIATTDNKDCKILNTKINILIFLICFGLLAIFNNAIFEMINIIKGFMNARL